ncbi:recombinase family protein [Nocardioides ochotonae]|uniref:recombinase family protein n=1 Tax=Nocardioides ochotonae TaxID=2685869 RepID=UPI0014090082|nr:recombinase family protein [Nocardioides ochotonae]
MTVKAAIYCRISKDREGGGLGVERQEKDCRDLAERLGWEVAAVFVDNDISAYSGKVRPQYRAMLDAVKAGQVTGIVAWHSDRLHRRAVELEEFVTLAEAHQLQVQTVTAGTVDLTTASGRMVARMLGAAAQHEVDHARERMRRAKTQAAASGKYRGGPRPYGYESDGMTIREDEAQVIRDMTTAVLAGRSLHAIARELNAKGLTTSTGRDWTQPRVKDVLIRPRNAGLIHHGRADGRTEGRHDRPEFQIVGKAAWPAIVTEDEWRAVHTMLVDPSRRTNLVNEPKWLLSNIAMCGREGCDSKMRATSNLWRRTGKDPQKPRTRRSNYRCRENNHLTIDAEKTDDWIRGVVAEMVRDDRIRHALTRGSGDAIAADRERRRQLVLRLEQTERDYDDDLIDARRLKAKSAKIEDEIAEIDARMASELQQSETARVMNAPDPGAAFLDAPLDVQRAVLRSVLTVTVLPAPKRGGAWTDERLRLDPVVPS